MAESWSDRLTQHEECPITPDEERPVVSIHGWVKVRLGHPYRIPVPPRRTVAPNLRLSVMVPTAHDLIDAADHGEWFC